MIGRAACRRSAARCGRTGQAVQPLSSVPLLAYLLTSGVRAKARYGQLQKHKKRAPCNFPERALETLQSLWSWGLVRFWLRTCKARRRSYTGATIHALCKFAEQTLTGSINESSRKISPVDGNVCVETRPK